MRSLGTRDDIHWLTEAITAPETGRSIDRSPDGPVISTARRHGVLPLLHRSLVAGSVGLEPSVEQEMLALLRQEAAHAAMLEARAVNALERLSAAGVRARVLKGVASAHLDYPEAELRPYRDVDLLIPGPDMAVAIDVLGQAGYRRRYEESFPGADNWFSKGACVVSGAGTELDLHRTIALGYFGTRLPADELWEGDETFRACGSTLSALDPVRRLVHAAIHLGLSTSPRLVNAHDVFVLVATRGPAVLDAAGGLARRWGCHVVFDQAVSDVQGLYAGVWPEWARRSPRSPGPGAWWQRAVLRAYDGGADHSAIRTASAVLGLQSWQERVRAVRMLGRRVVSR